MVMEIVKKINNTEQTYHYQLVVVIPSPRILLHTYMYYKRHPQSASNYRPKSGVKHFIFEFALSNHNDISTKFII